MRNIFIFLTLIFTVITVNGQHTFDFYGYRGTEMGANKIVEPRVAAKGRPWVIRARFWGHEPQVDTALLARGFHVTYCDVADLFGAPVAVKRYDEFYRQMTEKFGLSEKVVLEGMSRGGLIVYNWAAQNVDKVAAIYADAPVMDIRRWPLDPRIEDADKMLAAYGFKDDAEAMAWRGNPVDHAAALVGVPIIHVVGMADDVVPVATNTDLFKDRLQAAGGFMTVVRKAGVGHHPHSLKDPTTIVNFILVACGMADNVCTAAVPGQEWRSGAGWSDGADWWANHEQISDLMARGADVVLLGNSITQGFGGKRSIVTYKPGFEVLDSVLDGRTWVSAGISGDRTQNLLWRVVNGGYAASGAKTVFVTIGVNNLTRGDDPTAVAKGIVAIASQAAKTFSGARIIVFGTLPFYDMAAQQSVQKVLADTSFEGAMTFVDPTLWFADASGALVDSYYGGDRLHLSAEGYARFAALIRSCL